MKKINTILSVLLLLLSVSCVREQIAAIEAPAGEEYTVPVVISFQEPVVLQARTKAELGMEMGVEPAISNIHVAVFGSDRYLKDYVSAFPCDADGNPYGDFASENTTSYYFLARLPISSKERVLHIIANGPSSLPFNAYENDIMQNLRVSDGNGAYWQRIVLPDGIKIIEDDVNGQPVPRQDANGEFIPTPETKAALTGISLIRNFASITVSSYASNFEIVKYTLCNMPRNGSIAMYSTNHGDWVPVYTDTGINLDGDYHFNYEDARDNTVKTYLGFPAEPELDTNIPTTADAFDAPGVAVAEGTPIYVYERAVTGENPPFLLLAARYNGSSDIHYWRLDLALDNDYFPIYRNYQYTINITGVTVDGYTDPGTAANHNSGTNFSVSLDTRTLPDISNGVVRLYVEKPNYDWVYTSATQKFWFKFLENGSTSGNLNQHVTVTEKEGNAIASFTVASSDKDATSNEREVSYTLNVPNGTSTLSSTLQVVGSYAAGGETYRLVRMVTIRVFNAKEVHPTLSPSTVADQEKQLTTLNIPLPWDLQASMFPMEILIEDSAKALNPMEYETMPVRANDVDKPTEKFKSLVDNATPSYCFVRTLNWSEYQRLRNSAELSGIDDIILSCDFETTKAFDQTTVYVYNKYFQTNSSGVTTAQVTLTGDKNNNITPNRQNVSGTAATVTVKSTGDWTLDIKLANGNVAAGASLNPESGTSTTGTNVAVTLPENVTANAIRYQLTLTNTSVSPALTRTAYITQEGIHMTITSATSTIGNDGGAITVTVESGARYVVELLDANGNVLSTSAEQTPTTSPRNHNVNIPDNGTLSERRWTVRARNLLSTIWSDLTVTQAAGTASLSIVDNEIRMTTTSATVNVGSSFNAYLKVYVPGITDPVVNQAVSKAAARNVAITGIPANTTGADRTLRVDLCNGDGAVIATGNITQLGTPYLSLTTSNANIGNTATAAALNIESEATWTLSVSGGLNGASLSPASGSATSGSAITLTVPVNNTLSAQTYTVTADNGSRNSSVTVTQAAGVASLAQVDSEIMMQESTAQVSVTTSFATTLKVFNDATNAEVYSVAVPATGSTASAKTVTVGANTGSAITYRVQLYNSDGDPVGNSITFVQKPMIRITAAAASVKGNENATVNVVSDVDWELSTTGGTLGSYSGAPTTGAEAVSLTMPVNYTTSDEIFTVTAQGTVDTSLSASVAITHRKVTVNSGSVSFDTGNGSSGQFMSSTSATSGNVTATFSAIAQYADDGGLLGFGARDYTQLNRTGVTLTINTSAIPNRKALTGLTMTFSGNNYTTTSVAVQGTSASTTSTTATSWTGEDTANTTVFALSGNNNSLRVTGFTVNYQYYSWE